ncbi:hypothetical protein NDU88_002635 [Pleurodeles waltl]|uniref:Integrase catalytic domain-containing protein n=1 Tax=Pleurodeles waltl TaxID=8319 RepID=A0AAV7VZV7_PLEWA|nr:hypothetical protein NDU88_002635 [Pleurodeles waltl]
MKGFLDSCGIRHARTALYNPRANGIVERANRMIKSGLQLAVVNGLDAGSVISELVWGYRTTENTTSCRVPFVDMRGRKPVSKLRPAWMERLLGGGGAFNGDSANETGDDNERMKPGDWVKIKSGRVRQGFSKFLGPFRVLQVHRWHVLLDNGQRWNFRRVAKFSSALEGGCARRGDDCSGYMLMKDEDLSGSSGGERKQFDGGSGDAVVGRSEVIIDAPVTCSDSMGASTCVPSMVSPRTVGFPRTTRCRRPPGFLNDYVT